MQEVDAWYVVRTSSSMHYVRAAMILKDIYLSCIRERSSACALLFVGFGGTEEVLCTPIVCLCVCVCLPFSECEVNLHTSCIQMQPEWENREWCDSTKIIKSSTQVAGTSWQNFRFAPAMHFNITIFRAIEETRLTSCFAFRMERKSVVFTYCFQLQLCQSSCRYIAFECSVCLFMLFLRERTRSEQYNITHLNY